MFLLVFRIVLFEFEGELKGRKDKFYKQNKDNNFSEFLLYYFREENCFIAFFFLMFLFDLSFFYLLFVKSE